LHGARDAGSAEREEELPGLILDHLHRRCGSYPRQPYARGAGVPRRAPGHRSIGGIGFRTFLQ
jgi:hypothetical protein